MTRTAQTVAIAASLLLTTGAFAPALPGQAQRSAGNPLLDEMTVLDNAIREIVSAVATGDGARVSKALEPVYEARKKTLEAIRSGSLKLPKNGDRVEDFIRRDDSYHAQLSALDRAGQRDDREAMLMITKQLMEGCVSCHRTFYK